MLKTETSIKDTKDVVVEIDIIDLNAVAGSVSSVAIRSAMEASILHRVGSVLSGGAVAGITATYRDDTPMLVVHATNCDDDVAKAVEREVNIVVGAFQVLCDTLRWSK